MAYMRFMKCCGLVGIVRLDGFHKFHMRPDFHFIRFVVLADEIPVAQADVMQSFTSLAQHQVVGGFGQRIVKGCVQANPLF